MGACNTKNPKAAKDLAKKNLEKQKTAENVE